ncbi:hypothetical protein ACFLXJ_07255, partial [Chloroflexota bacterium]
MEKPGEVLFLSGEDVYSVLTADDCLKRCIDTFKWVGEGQVDQVNPVTLQLSPFEGPYSLGTAISFPAHVKPLHVVGNKWL